MHNQIFYKLCLFIILLLTLFREQIHFKASPAVTHASALTMSFLLPCNKHPEKQLETQLHLTTSSHLQEGP